ncbi:glycosyltransferase family 2 protein [Kaistia adipata]|uniref:glycosyltransferase family 2 protein n=1 Tax=Kaistia adipata TaxID=166954 RepID=UPI0009FDE9C4|nr:glycosyltransferase family 2 protein [Kaistia adipata]
MSRSISAVTVTYNSAGIVREALACLPDGPEIICVDNASTDDLGSVLQGLPVRRIDNGRNLGFGCACNIGAAAASGEFILFINPDVRVTPRSIDALLEAVERYPDCNVFSPRTTTPKGRLWFRDQTEVDRLSGTPPPMRVREIAGDCCVRFVDGGIFLIRRSLFLEMGGFDEGIFLYFEDDDLSHRLRQRNEQMILVSDAHAIHDVGNSVERSALARIHRHRAKAQSEVYLRRKYKIPFKPGRAFVQSLAKASFYCLTLNRDRLLNTLGRLLGLSEAIRNPTASGYALKSDRDRPVR